MRATLEVILESIYTTRYKLHTLYVRFSSSRDAICSWCGAGDSIGSGWTGMRGAAIAGWCAGWELQFTAGALLRWYGGTESGLLTTGGGDEAMGMVEECDRCSGSSSRRISPEIWIPGVGSQLEAMSRKWKCNILKTHLSSDYSERFNRDNIHEQCCFVGKALPKVTLSHITSCQTLAYQTQTGLLYNCRQFKKPNFKISPRFLKFGCLSWVNKLGQQRNKSCG